jgi:nicotinamide-nucleotide amidase
MTSEMTAQVVIARLVETGLSVATAESLTGGLVCAALTDVPGASATVRGAVVAYASDVKAGLLHVDPALLAFGGAVQEEVARQMARGVCRVLRADVGVATTGVAGPDPQDGQPVGTVFIAVAWGREVQVRQLALPGSRNQIRQASVTAALDLLAGVLGRSEDRAEPPR